jgi:hypothetical protein
VIACVAAELNSGIGTLYALEHGQRADMAVVAEPYGARTILTKHTGTMDVVVHTIGRATHISKKEQGVDAIGLMTRAIDAINRMELTHVHDPELPGLPRLNVGSIIGGRGREHNLRGAYTVSDFCTAYVNVRFNASQTGETVLADIRRVLDGLAAADPRFQYEIEFPPLPARGLGRLAKAAVDVPKTEPIVQMVRRNLRHMTAPSPSTSVSGSPRAMPATTPRISGPPAFRAASMAPAAATPTITTCTWSSPICSSARACSPSPPSRRPSELRRPVHRPHLFAGRGALAWGGRTPPEPEPRARSHPARHRWLLLHGVALREGAAGGRQGRGQSR